jgi:hypothetical protein
MSLYRIALGTAFTLLLAPTPAAAQVFWKSADFSGAPVMVPIPVTDTGQIVPMLGAKPRGDCLVYAFRSQPGGVAMPV